MTLPWKACRVLQLKLLAQQLLNQDHWPLYILLIITVSDQKFHVLGLHHYQITSLSDATVRMANSEYSVAEDGGSVMVCVEISSVPEGLLELELIVNLALSPERGTGRFPLQLIY